MVPDTGATHKLRQSPWALPHKRFYEKVIKVKGDVAALLNLFSDVSHRHPMVTCGAGQGRRRRAAFILTLDRPASYFTIEFGTKRNAVQLSFVP